MKWLRENDLLQWTLNVNTFNIIFQIIPTNYPSFPLTTLLNFPSFHIILLLSFIILGLSPTHLFLVTVNSNLQIRKLDLLLIQVSSLPSILLRLCPLHPSAPCLLSSLFSIQSSSPIFSVPLRMLPLKSWSIAHPHAPSEPNLTPLLDS